jgi:glycosyltransferase involved in cell wall biosynthesis
MTKKIVFFCRDSLENIQSMEYYRQDLDALHALGHDVIICTRYRDIPAQFDLMYIWWWTYALYPVLLAKLRRRKSLVTGVFNFRFEDKSSGTDYFARPLYQRILIRLATVLTDGNLFISEREFQSVPPYFNLQNVHYFPCAVGVEYFWTARTGAQRQGLLNLAWSGSENLKRKGVWDILDAVHILKKRGVAAPLTLAGKTGDGFAALQQRVVDLGLQDCVKTIGEVTKDEKLRLYSEALLYLQPSYFEGFGLATAEAMAAGCCVITCDVGEVRNVVGDAGEYVCPGNPEELADRIAELITNPSRTAALTNRAAERLERLFSFNKKKADLNKILGALGHDASGSMN